MKFLFIASLFFIQVAWCQDIPYKTGSNINQSDAKQFLDHHNKVRAQVHTPPLTWSPKLASFAQSWADHLVNNKRCNLMHSDGIDDEGRTLGENIFWGSDRDSFSALDASIGWYEEKSDYKYAPIGGAGQDKIGHYTQMVWKNTRQVGVGIGYCKDGGIMIVASYYPAGNYIGEYPY